MKTSKRWLATFQGTSPVTFPKQMERMLTTRTIEAARDAFFEHAGERWREVPFAAAEAERVLAGERLALPLPDGRTLALSVAEFPAPEVILNAVLVGTITLESQVL